MMSNDWQKYDIAWCVDSATICNHTDCFRHYTNQPKTPDDEPFVCTWMCFYNTIDCPYYRKENDK